MPVIEIKKIDGKNRRRRGRGIGSGRGGYSGRGAKGQKARTGGSIRPGYEGGQMPVYRRTPKRGFKNNERIEFNILNISALSEFKADAAVSIELLKEKGLIKLNKQPVKLLGNGDLKVNGLKISVNACSQAAKAKIEALGGQVTII